MRPCRHESEAASSGLIGTARRRDSQEPVCGLSEHIDQAADIANNCVIARALYEKFQI